MKPRTMYATNLFQDPIRVLSEKFEKLFTDLIQSQTALLNRMTNLERDRGQQSVYHPRQH